MFIDREVSINSSIEDAWKVMGDDFANPHKWASLISHAEVHGEGKNGAPCSVRQCEVVGFGTTDEPLLQYSAKDHLLSYEVKGKGFPPMVKYVSTTWKLSEIGPGKTKFTMRNEVRVEGIMGAVIKPMMKLQMGKQMLTTMRDFKHYVETGKPSAEKVEALKKSLSTVPA